jgi:hypothetical protein
MDTRAAVAPESLCFFARAFDAVRQALDIDGEVTEVKELTGESEATYIRGCIVSVALPHGRGRILPLSAKVVSRRPARGTLGGREVDQLVFNVMEDMPGAAKDDDSAVVKWRVNQLVPNNQYRFQLVVEGDRESSLEFSLLDINVG